LTTIGRGAAMTYGDRFGDAFRRALDEARRPPWPQPEMGQAPIARPGFGARFDLAPARGGGGEARWGLAMAWADESRPPRVPATHLLTLDPVPASTDVAEAVACELGVGAGLSAEALTERWRAFVWRNHPDRLPACERERAKARVAVANALYDRARRQLRRA
jgi:hypothetical protein